MLPIAAITYIYFAGNSCGKVSDQRMILTAIHPFSDFLNISQFEEWRFRTEISTRIEISIRVHAYILVAAATVGTHAFKIPGSADHISQHGLDIIFLTKCIPTTSIDYGFHKG
jgi:hypothetical protein